MQVPSPSSEPSPELLQTSPHSDPSALQDQTEEIGPIAATCLSFDSGEDAVIAESQALTLEITNRFYPPEAINQTEREGEAEHGQNVEHEEQADRVEQPDREADQANQGDQAALDAEEDRIEPSNQAVEQELVESEGQQYQTSDPNNSAESIVESTMAALNNFFPSAIQVSMRFSVFPPVIFSITKQSEFASKERILKVLDGTWDLYQDRILDPVCYSDRTNPLAGFNNLDYQYVKEAVVMLVHICTSWKCREDPSFSVAGFFYDRLERYFTSKCEKYYGMVVKKRKFKMLDLAARLTKKHFLDTRFIMSFFLVIDRTYVRLSDMPDVRAMLGNCYMSTIYVRIRERLQAVVVSSVEEHRSGVRRTICIPIICYRALLANIANGIDPFVQNDWNGYLLQNCFNHVFDYLETPKQGCLCHYVALIRNRVRELREFAVGDNLVPRFLSLLRTLNHTSFFGAQQIPEEGENEGISSRPPVIHFLEHGCYKALYCVFKIFGPEEDFIKKIASTFEEHIQVKLVPDFKQSVDNEALPFEFFSKFMHTWIRVVTLSVASRDCRLGNVVVADALENPFKPVVCQHAQIFTSQLELYFDTVLSKTKFKERVLPGQSLEDETFAIVFMLRLLPRPGEFLREYTNKLVRRIPREDIPARRAESLLVPMVRAYSHMEEIEKLRGVLSIVARKVRHTKAFKPQALNTLFHFDKVRLFGAKAVRDFDWPDRSVIPMEIPDNMQDTVAHYAQFMEREHPDKNFVLNFSCDTVIVNTNIFSRKGRNTKFHMSTNQMCILNMFQITESLTIESILEKIRPQEEDKGNPVDQGELKETVFKCLKSLTAEQYPLLRKIPATDVFESQDLISINSDFKTEEKLIVLPLP